MTTVSVHGLIKEIIEVEKKRFGRYPLDNLELVRYKEGKIRDEQYVRIDPLRMTLNINDRGSDEWLTIYAEYPDRPVDYSKIPESVVITALEFTLAWYRKQPVDPLDVCEEMPVYEYRDDEPSPFGTPGDEQFPVSMDWMEWCLLKNRQCKTLEHAEALGRALIEDLIEGRQVKAGPPKASLTGTSRVYFHHLVKARELTETWEMAHRLATFQHARLFNNR